MITRTVKGGGHNCHDCNTTKHTPTCAHTHTHCELLPLELSSAVTTATAMSAHTHTRRGLCLLSHTCPYPLPSFSPCIRHTHTHTVVLNGRDPLTLAALGARPSRRLPEVLKPERISQMKDSRRCQLLHSPFSTAHSSSSRGSHQIILSLHSPTHTWACYCYCCRCFPMTRHHTSALLTLPFWLLKQTCTVWEKVPTAAVFSKTHFTLWVAIKMHIVPGALLCDNSVRKKGKSHSLLELKSVLKTVPEFVSKESLKFICWNLGAFEKYFYYIVVKYLQNATEPPALHQSSGTTLPNELQPPKTGLWKCLMGQDTKGTRPDSPFVKP